MTTDDFPMALPVTVYAANVRYDVRPEFDKQVPEDSHTVFVLHQFPKAGESPLAEDQVLAEARGVIEADTISGGPLDGRPIGEVYAQSGPWTYMAYVIRPHPVTHGKVE